MFLFKNKKKKRSNDEVVDQEGSTVNNDIYVKNDHLLNIKLPDDFSSIVLPQLIGFEQDENGNTISPSAAIQSENNGHHQHHQHRHATPICREGWYPVTRFIGSESSRGTLVDTTNITAASLVQANKRLSVSFSSSYGDTLTCHSKEDSDNDHSACSDLLIDHPPLPASPFSNSDSACIDRSSSILHHYVPHLRKDRPKFKRNHPRSKVLLVGYMHVNTLNESSTTTATTTPIIDSKQSSSTTSITSASNFSSSATTTTSSSFLPPRCISPATLVDDENTILTTMTDTPCRIPINKLENNNNEMEKKLKPPTAIPLTTTKRKKSQIKPLNETSLLKPRQLKRHSMAESPAPINNVTVGDGSMIPRRPRSTSSSSSSQDTLKVPTEVTLPQQQQQQQQQPSRKKQQSRKQSLSTTGSGSRIPVRAQTMKV